MSDHERAQITEVSPATSPPARPAPSLGATSQKIGAIDDQYLRLALTPVVQQDEDKYSGKHQSVDNAPKTDTDA